MKKFMYLALASSLLLAGCGGEKTAEKSLETGKEVSKTEVQEFKTFLGAEPKTLDISKATDSYSSVILALNNEGLVSAHVDEKGVESIVPAGAESWEISEDGMKYTFKLRENAAWSDGQKITAHDYVYGMLRTLDPVTGSLYAFLMSPIKGADEYNSGKIKAEEVGVKALDDLTLEVTLAKPTAYFLELGYFKVMFPQRKDIIEKSGDKYGSEADTLIANGPFILKEWVHNNKVVLEKNPTYWDKENVKLEKIEMAIVPDENARMNLMLNGQVDVGGATKPEWMDKFNQMGVFDFISKSALGTNYTTFNTQSKYFKNPKVRKAFSMAVNREELNDVLFNGRFVPAYGWVAKGIQIGGKEYREQVGEPLNQLLKSDTTAVDVLKEGLKELGLPEDPSQVTINFLSSGTSEWSRKYAEYLQQMYKKNLGVEIKAEFVEWPVYQKRNDELDYEMGGQAWTGDYNDPNTFLDMWISTAGIVKNGWKSSEYDNLIDKASKTADVQERLEYFKQAEKMLVVDEAVIAPTLYRMNSTFVRKYVKGYNPPTVPGVYNMKGVSIEGK
ncbi:MAG: peptide ABC transporter substrate-binding protein [Fusobacteriaceae bacterium]